jgi:cyanophycin synthetase
MEMVQHLPDKPVILFSLDANNSEIKKHLAHGGTAYAVTQVDEEPIIVRLEGHGSKLILPVADVPITMKGSASHNTANVLAALAALHGLGIEDQQSANGVLSFQSDPAFNSGRLNSVSGFPFEVILDYAHNKPAFQAMVEFARRRGAGRRKLCVVTMNGARVSDDVAFDAMTTLARDFDHYVTCNFDKPKYGRDGFPKVLQRGLMKAGVREEMISMADGEQVALDQALALARPGDLVLVMIGFEPEKLTGCLERLTIRANAFRTSE